MTTAEPLLDRVRDVARAYVEKHHLPSIGIALVRRDGSILTETFGLADIESKSPLELRHRHRIGSITKTMVGLCAMALVEEGRLSLDARVCDLLPDVGLNAWADDLQLTHLLTHTGGIGEAPTLTELADLENSLWADEGIEIGTVAEQYGESGIDLEAAPGTRWCYANHGWSLVGEIVARVEQADIAEVVRRRIFQPLHMLDSDLLDRNHPDLSSPYHRAPTDDERELAARTGRELLKEPTVDGVNVRGRYQHVRGRAAGAVQCTLPDLARYTQALLRQSEGIVNPATFTKMTSPQFCPDPRLQNMGLAFFREDAFGREAFGHNGGVVGGWSSFLKIFPRENLGIVVHANSFGGHPTDLEWDITLAALGLDRPVLTDAPIDASLLEAAPGVYESRSGKLLTVRIAGSTGRLQIVRRGAELWLYARRGDWKAGARMCTVNASEPELFELDTEAVRRPKVALVRGADGRVTGLRHERLVEMVRSDADGW